MLTGGAGFIGSTLVSKLYKDNEILVYDNFSRDSLTYKNLKSKHLSIVKGDVLDSDLLARTVEDFRPQIAVHLASIAGVDTVIKNPVKTLEIILLGTFNFLRSFSYFSLNIC